MKISKQIIAALLVSTVLMNAAWQTSVTVSSEDSEQSAVQASESETQNSDENENSDESENEKQDEVLFTAFKDGEEIAVETELTEQGQVIYLSEGTVLKFRKPQDEDFEYTYLYRDSKTNRTFTAQTDQGEFIFKAVKKGSFQVTLSKYNDTFSEDMAFEIVVNDGAETYSDNALNVEDTFKINMGMSQTIALSGGAYSFVGVDSSRTNRVEVTKLSKNVINVFAKKAGTVYLCTIDNEGIERIIKVNIRDCIYRTPKNDIVSLNSALFTTKVIPDGKDLKRDFSVNTGKTIVFSKVCDMAYTYEYFYRDSSGKDICIRSESENDVLKFTPAEPGKYVISVVVRDNSKNFSKKEIFTITVNGKSLGSVRMADTVVCTQTKTVALSDDVKDVWSSNENIAYSISGSEVSFEGLAEGTSKVILLTENGYVYEDDLRIEKRMTEPFVLKEKAVTLNVKNTYQIGFSDIGDDADITYKSSDPSVVSVSSDGVLKALKAGEAEITVSNRISSDKVKVTVDTSSIRFDIVNVQMLLNKKIALKPVLDKGSTTAVTFSSSDKNVASVDKNGIVTAKKEGSVVVTARTSNNLTAYCRIAVIDVPSDVEMSFASVCPTVHIGKTVTLDIRLSDPKYAKYVTVKVSDQNKAAVSYKDGRCTIKGLKAGRLYLTASLPNGRSITTMFYSTGNYSAYRTSYAVERGIDVSCFNPNVDYKKLKELGYTFIIIRDGFGNELSQEDELFQKHILGAKKAGLGIGIYHFCYALNAADAKKEAKVCNQIIAKYRGEITHGVYYDYEEDSRRYAEQRGYYQNRQAVTDIIDTFCSEMERYGFVAGVYTDTYDRNTYFDMNRLDKYLFWYAAPGFTSFDFEFDIWQHTFELRSSAFSGYADGDKIFSTIFKELK